MKHSCRENVDKLEKYNGLDEIAPSARGLLPHIVESGITLKPCLESVAHTKHLTKEMPSYFCLLSLISLSSRLNQLIRKIHTFSSNCYKIS